MTASFRHVDLDTHLRSIIKAGSKVAINHYEKAAAPDKSMVSVDDELDADPELRVELPCVATPQATLTQIGK